MYFRDANGEYAVEVGLMARDLGQDVDVYLLGGPKSIFQFSDAALHCAAHVMVDLTAEDVTGLQLTVDRRAAFFAIPENRRLHADLQRIHPGGAHGVIHRKSRPGEILFDYYLVKP